ncbi:MAG: multiubiquitin domain-containing protein [Burkholderiales bacterium]|nr:multiubiquitin domain-containing protein [Burkholderiales bacterium]
MNELDVVANRESDKEKHVAIHITVNFKTVTVTKKRATGLEIKQAAINQGVNIKLDFVLFEDKGNGHRKVIGDADVVHLHEGSKFEAIPHDDNS